MPSDVGRPVTEWVGIEPRVALAVATLAPLMLQQLRRDSSSRAFDNFDVSVAADDDDGISLLHTLRAVFTQASEEGEGERGSQTVMSLACSGLSWSVTGSVLFASFGRVDHTGWCTHRAGLCTWNLFRRELNPDKPDVVLESLVRFVCLRGTVSLHSRPPCRAA